MKIKLNSDDKVPLNKMLKIPTTTLVVIGIFLESNKYYSQVFLNERLYEL